LIKCLKDSNPYVRYDALIGLSYLQNEAKAKAAVPVLVDLLKDPDTALHGTVEALLKTIDPEAAAKAGIK
jgi:HEAT repeat protein